jgi:hypothetical protein
MPTTIVIVLLIIVLLGGGGGYYGYRGYGAGGLGGALGLVIVVLLVLWLLGFLSGGVTPLRLGCEHSNGRIAPWPMPRGAIVSEEVNHARFCSPAFRNRFHWWNG